MKDLAREISKSSGKAVFAAQGTFPGSLGSLSTYALALCQGLGRCAKAASKQHETLLHKASTTISQSWHLRVTLLEML